jgi:histone H3/H4
MSSIQQFNKSFIITCDKLGVQASQRLLQFSQECCKHRNGKKVTRQDIELAIQLARIKTQHAVRIHHQ